MIIYKVRDGVYSVSCRAYGILKYIGADSLSEAIRKSLMQF